MNTMNSTAITTTNQTTTPAQFARVDGDAHLVAMWLQNARSNSAHTESAYQRSWVKFNEFTGGVPLRSLTLNDIQDYLEFLQTQTREDGDPVSPESIRGWMAGLKSLLSYGHRLGYLAFNVGAAVKLPKGKDTLAERILTEEEVIRIVTGERNARNRAMIRVLYSSGGRVSEVCGLTWADIRTGEDGAVTATLFGKGNKTRYVKLSPTTSGALATIKPIGAKNTEPVFRSNKGGPLTRQQVQRIVRTAGERAGVGGHVSPHWFRHSHATHAMGRGASISLVSKTLGHSSEAITSRYLHVTPGESSSAFLPI